MQLEMYLNVKRMIQIGETYLGGISVRFFSVAHTVNNLLAMQESSGEGNGNPRLENPMDRGVWWATVYGLAKSKT